ncbi:hypothetical protein PIB30_008673 [Stylosanthes scabra]|uniref:Uncharacterized protein n=1 Tax=Stylosanthes scabra TaxID=79078 RepID=A0ABU6T6A2_9FABA|nr:hypothetical protein [Stylosanthes scabra]
MTNRSLNDRADLGYIKGRSALPSGSQILIWRFFSSTLPTSHINLQPSVLVRPVTSGVPNPRRYIMYIGAVCGDFLEKPTMVNQEEEGGAQKLHEGLKDTTTFALPATYPI